MSETLLGFLISGGASLAVAIVGGYFMIKARRTPQTAEQTAITDVWEENRKRGEHIDKLDGKVRDLTKALGVAVHWIQRAQRDWNTGFPPPAFTDRDLRILSAVGEDLDFDPDETAEHVFPELPGQ